MHAHDASAWVGALTLPCHAHASCTLHLAAQPITHIPCPPCIAICVRVLILPVHAPLHAMPCNTHLAAFCTAGSCQSPPAPQSARRSRRHARRLRHRKVDRQPCSGPSRGMQSKLLPQAQPRAGLLGRLSATLCSGVRAVMPQLVSDGFQVLLRKVHSKGPDYVTDTGE